MSVNDSKETAAKKPSDYSDEERYGRARALLFALLKWLECEFFGVFIFLSLLALRVVMGRAGDVIFGVLGFITYIMVMADFGFKEGCKARIKNDVRGDNVKRGFGVLLGAVSIVPPLLTLGVLGLSYAGAVPSAVLPFKALNSGLWGIINLFVGDMEIAHLHPAVFAVYPALQLILAAVTAGAFSVGFNNEDLETRLMYRKSK